MARLNPTANSMIREYVEASAIAVALVLCMPLLGIGIFLFRGVAAGVAILVLLLVGGVAAWRWAEPRLTPNCRVIVREVAVGAAFLAGIPVFAIAAVALGGLVAILLPLVAVVLGVAGFWRIIGAGRHVFHDNVR